MLISQWFTFMEVLAWNYRLDADTCMEVWKQAPNARACASAAFWKEKYGCNLLPNAQAIQTKRGKIYDISATDGAEKFQMWKFRRIFSPVFVSILSYFLGLDEKEISCQNNFLADLREVIGISAAEAPETSREVIKEIFCYIVAIRLEIQADKLANIEALKTGIEKISEEDTLHCMEFLCSAAQRLLFAAQRAELYLEEFNRNEINYFAPGWYKELSDLRRQSKGPASFLKAMREIYGVYRRQGETLFLPTCVIRGSIKFTWERIAYIIEAIETGRTLNLEKLPKWQSPQEGMTEEDIRTILLSGELYHKKENEWRECLSQTSEEEKVLKLSEAHYAGEIHDITYAGAKGYCWLNKDGAFIFLPGKKYCLITWRALMKRMECSAKKAA